MSLRPITTARVPAMAIADRSSSSMTPEGVQATSAERPCTSRPTLVGCRPSTSFAGSIASNTRRSASGPISFGSGDCTRMPSCTSLLVQPRSTRRNSSSTLAVAGQPFEVRADAGLARRLQLAPDVQLGRRVVADQHERDAGRTSRLARERLDLRPDIGANGLTDRDSIQQASGHYSAASTSSRRSECGRPSTTSLSPARMAVSGSGLKSM